VPYSAVQGAGFYRHFIDRAAWPDFMRAGRADALHALRRWAAGREQTPRLKPRSRGATNATPAGPRTSAKPARPRTPRARTGR
jgi:hypothetical protein